MNHESRSLRHRFQDPPDPDAADVGSSQRDFGRRGVIWQYEYFDRIVRDQHELMSKVNYILGNPARKWPELQEYAWVGCGFPLGDDSEAARV
jgi:hypothetical protein